MEASCSCSVQSCLFVQSWPRHFLVQCQENVCNVGGAFVAADYHQKIKRFKVKIAKKWCYSDDIGFFPVQCCLESLEQCCTEFVPVQCCQDFFMWNVFWRLLDNIAQGFYLCNVVPKVLRQHWAGFLPVQFCLEPIGQHCTRFLPVQCCPNSIKTKLNRIFSCVMLSGASWITLHKAQSFYLSNVVPRVLRL